MNATTTVLSFIAGEAALFDGQPVTIQGSKGRWVQILTAEGLTKNVGRASLAPAPAPEVAPAPSSKCKYHGPMLILRERAKKNLYRTAENGNPCCGDELATACGAYKPEIVVKALIKAIGFDHNPYAHLNIGQQSMNLRNKARGLLKSGLLRIDDVAMHLNITHILAQKEAEEAAALMATDTTTA